MYNKDLDTGKYIQNVSQELNPMGGSSRGITNRHGTFRHARSVCDLLNNKCAVWATFFDKLDLSVVRGKTASLPALESLIRSTPQIHLLALPTPPPPMGTESPVSGK